MPRIGDRRRVIYALLLLTAVAVALRLFHLDYKSLNGGDEPYQFALAQRPFGEMLSLFGYEANASVYSVLLWPLVRIGESEELIRSPAVLFGILAVPAIWWTGRTFVTDRVGLMAAALMAVSPMAVFQSQFARPFTLIICLACVSFVALRLAIDEGRTRWWVVYALALAGMAYSNALTPFLLGLVHLWMVWRDREIALREWLLSVAGALVLCIPQAIALVVARSRRDPLYYLEAPGLGAVNNTAREFTSGLGGSNAIYAATMLLLLGVLAVVAWRRWRGDEGDEPEAWLGVPDVFWLWAFVPVVVLLAVSQIEPAYRTVYVIGILPGLLLLVAALIDRLGDPLRWLALGAAVVLGLAGTIWQTTRQVDETWYSTMDFIASERQPGDRVLLDIVSVLPVLGYYDDRYRAPNGELIVLEWDEYPLPEDIVPLDDPGGYAGPAGPPSRGMIQRLASGDQRLFVVLAEYQPHLQGDIPSGPAIDWARENCDVRERKDEVFIDLFLISDCPAPGASES